MAKLITLKGPRSGMHYPCASNPASIGRQPDCAICLDNPSVSRVHARLIEVEGQYYIEDLESSNGTYLNGERLEERALLTEDDTLQIGPFHLALRLQDVAIEGDTDSIIRSQINALSSHRSLFSQNAEQKLQMFVETARSLGRTLDMQPLLDKLLEQLFRLFPQADRGMVILCQGGEYVPKAQLSRDPVTNLTDSAPGERSSIAETTTSRTRDLPFSRTLVKRALEDGVGLLSSNAKDDPTLPSTETMAELNLRSLMCVPLIGLDRRQIGVVQLDCRRIGHSFKEEDLELLTALGLQVSGVLENAALHEERLEEERLRKELALAREIQQSFLTSDFSPFESNGYELYAQVEPAREVSGDLYDVLPREDRKVSFFLGDVSGKGMPAALFMIMVRTLTRVFAPTLVGPGEMLSRLNDALVADNPTSLFVTMAHGVYDPGNGNLTLVSGGQPAPILRRSTGEVSPVSLVPCMMLGYDHYPKPPEETTIQLDPGDMVVLYSDGLSEAFSPKREMFGEERLQKLVGEAGGVSELEEVANDIRKGIHQWTQSEELQDDQTLFILRRTV